jgi:hypothetical protein
MLMQSAVIQGCVQLLASVYNVQRRAGGGSSLPGPLSSTQLLQLLQGALAHGPQGGVVLHGAEEGEGQGPPLVHVAVGEFTGAVRGNQLSQLGCLPQPAITEALGAGESRLLWQEPPAVTASSSTTTTSSSRSSQQAPGTEDSAPPPQQQQQQQQEVLLVLDLPPGSYDCQVTLTNCSSSSLGVGDTAGDLQDLGMGPLVAVGGAGEEAAVAAADKGKCRVLVFTEQRVFLDLVLPLQPAMR